MGQSLSIKRSCNDSKTESEKKQFNKKKRDNEGTYPFKNGLIIKIGQAIFFFNLTKIVVGHK